MAESTDADASLIVNVLFVNNMREALALRSGAAYGLGAAQGSLDVASRHPSHYSYSVGQATSEAAIVGAAFALAGGLIAAATEEDTFRAISDVMITDHRASGATSQSAVSPASGDGNPSQHELGANSKPTLYATRVFVEAADVGLDRDEALPMLRDTTVKKIADIF